MIVSATWSLTAREVSGPDCICIADIDAETDAGISGALLGASALRATSIASE